MAIEPAGRYELMEYIGASQGDAIWYGATGRKYRAGGVTRIFAVDANDVPAFLGIQAGHQPFFRCYQADPSRLTVDEIRDLAKTADPAMLRAMLEAEQASKARKSAIEVLEDALAA